MQAARYTVDLTGYMAECEANYARLMKLLISGQDLVSYQVSMPGHHVTRVDFRILQRCKYTTMLTIDKGSSSSSEGSSWLANNHFECRVYHDAQMVEVVAFQQNRGIKPAYPYPNRKMYQKDEKFQQNRFLSECLSNCLKNGMCIIETELA